MLITGDPHTAIEIEVVTHTPVGASGSWTDESPGHVGSGPA
jgi:hypothetical protein